MLQQNQAIRLPLYYGRFLLYNAKSIKHKTTYIFTRSPSLSVISGSLKRGEKWQTQLFTEIHVGKAIPSGTRESRFKKGITRT